MRRKISAKVSTLLSIECCAPDRQNYFHTKNSTRESNSLFLPCYNKPTSLSTRVVSHASPNLFGLVRTGGDSTLWQPLKKALSASQTCENFYSALQSCNSLLAQSRITDVIHQYLKTKINFPQHVSQYLMIYSRVHKSLPFCLFIK